MTASTPMLITFLVYILGMVLIGFIAYRATRNFDDYILGTPDGELGDRPLRRCLRHERLAPDGPAGRRLHRRHLRELDRYRPHPGAYLNWRWVAGRLRVHTEKNRNALTLPDYFTYRFEDKSRVLRILSALVILLFFTIYCASGVVAGARLFESTFGMSYDTALWVGAAATITYTFFGGFLAVSWTDTVQATLMIFALILTPVFVIIAVGGIDTAMVQVAAQNASNLDMFKNLTSSPSSR